MNEEVTILIGEDDDGHATLLKKNLRRSGLANPIIRFRDGQQVVDFLFRNGPPPHRKPQHQYLLLLDIRMPRLNGQDVLRRVKQSDDLRRMPVIMVTTTDDPREIAACHELGCGNYVVKPVDYDAFVATIRQLGMYLSVVQVPSINGIQTLEGTDASGSGI